MQNEKISPVFFFPGTLFLFRKKKTCAETREVENGKKQKRKE
jgi:hypothetical protein